MSLVDAVSDPARRRTVAAEAVREAEAAIRERRGLQARAARVGLDTINLLRPGFLERQVHLLLPAMADAVEPWWRQGTAEGDPIAVLERDAAPVAEALLEVTDAHVARADDRAAIAVYQRLRPAAARRVTEQMPRIARFVERWSE